MKQAAFGRRHGLTNGKAFSRHSQCSLEILSKLVRFEEVLPIMAMLSPACT